MALDLTLPLRGRCGSGRLNGRFWTRLLTAGGESDLPATMPPWLTMFALYRDQAVAARAFAQQNPVDEFAQGGVNRVLGPTRRRRVELFAEKFAARAGVSRGGHPS